LKFRLQLFGFKDGPYERPNQKWVCGWTCEGRPCSVGPDAKGQCTANAQTHCDPRQDGDRWLCTRLNVFGGACELGPSPEGACCHPTPEHSICQPELSLRAKRGRVVRLSVALAFGLLVYFLVGPTRLDFISPGELTKAHANLESTEGTGHQCGQCHHAADAHSATGLSWLSASLNRTDPFQETSKCLSCHFLQGNPSDDHAHYAHTLQPNQLKQHAQSNHAGIAKPLLNQTVNTSAVNPHGKMACSTCHREHQGRLHNLTFMSDRQCQSCHTTQFKSFAHGHPEFKNTRARKGIAFDHLLHRAKATSAGKRFDCATCHVTSRFDQIGSNVALKNNCISCHNHKTELKQGQRSISLLRLPQMKEGLRWWDGEVASQDKKEALLPFLWLMLSGDDQAVAPLAAMWSSNKLKASPAVSLLDHPELQKQLADALKALILELSHDDPQPLISRLTKVLQLSPDHPSVASLTHLLRSGQGKIYDYAVDEVDLVPQKMKRKRPAQTPFNVYLDNDDVPAVRFRVSSREPDEDSNVDASIAHGNPLIKAWLDALAANATLPPVKVKGEKTVNAKDEAMPVDISPIPFRARIRTELFRSEIAKFNTACIKCHTVESNQTSSRINWTTPPRNANYQQFNHGTHLGVRPKIQNCAHCHHWEGDDLKRAKKTLGGFVGHARHDCATCHTPKRQNASCVSCHKYHLHKR
jgi:hypothetical protein